jgi:hypothetical protein
MRAEGWSTYIWGPKSKAWLRLPNTTLIGKFETKTSARATFAAARRNTMAAGYRVKVEKFIIVEFLAWTANSDVKVRTHRRPR